MLLHKKQRISGLAEQLPALAELAVYSCAELAAELDSSELGRRLGALEPERACAIMQAIAVSLAPDGPSDDAHVECSDAAFVNSLCDIARGTPLSDPMCMHGDSVVCLLRDNLPPAFPRVRELPRNVCDVAMEFFRYKTADAMCHGESGEEVVLTCGHEKMVSYALTVAVTLVASRNVQATEDELYDAALTTACDGIYRELHDLELFECPRAEGRTRAGDLLRGGLMTSPVMTLQLTRHL